MWGLDPRQPTLSNTWSEAEVLCPRHVAPLTGDGLDDSPLQLCRACGEAAVARLVGLRRLCVHDSGKNILGGDLCLDPPITNSLNVAESLDGSIFRSILILHLYLNLTPEACQPSQILITGINMGEDRTSDPAALPKRARDEASMKKGTVPFSIKDEPVENQRRMRVIIIGAGFSGIYTTVRSVAAE